jgi:hypothetical protein
MSKYPRPPFDTKHIFIEDTFDPELGASETVVDLNDFTNEKLSELYFSDPLAKKLLEWRWENNVGLGEEDTPEG